MVEESVTIVEELKNSVCIEYPRRVLFLNEHFLVIEKPFDLRMNGAFDQTVDTVVKSWLHKSEKVNFIHNLDFATSGVLAGGFTKDGTGWGSGLLNDRLASKIYASVLHGEISSQFISNLPVIDDTISFQSIVMGKRVGEVLVPAIYKSSSHLVNEKISECLTRYLSHSSPIDVQVILQMVDSHVILNGFIQEKTDSFQVKLVADHAESETARGAYTVLIPQSTSLFQNYAVTRVLLLPFTGRRHQLRIHTASILHMHIVGDYSYGGAIDIEGNRTREYERMLLHAQFLFLPFTKKSRKYHLFDEVPLEVSHEVKIIGSVSDVSGQSGLSIMTSDPFPFI